MHFHGGWTNLPEPFQNSTHQDVSRYQVLVHEIFITDRRCCWLSSSCLPTSPLVRRASPLSAAESLSSLSIANARSLLAGAPPNLISLPLHATLRATRSNGHEYTVRRLSERPHTFLLQGFLSSEECEALIASAKRRGFDPAETTGKSDARRRCDVALVSPSQEPVLAAVQSDAARLLLSSEALQTPGGGVEELNVLHYRPGGEYRLQCVVAP